MFHHSEDKDHFEVLKFDTISKNEIPGSTKNNDIEEEIEEERKEEEMRTFKTTPKLPEKASTTTSSSTTTVTDTPSVAPSTSSTPSQSSKVVDQGDAIFNKFVQIYKSEHHKRNKLKKPMRKYSKFF